MKILLLGSTGAFGTALERVCEEKNIEYVGLSHKDFEITKKDDLFNAITKNNPDVVVNSVAIIGLNPCEQNPQRAFDINAIEVSNLAKICKERDIVLVQPSTHAVFDGTKEDCYTEEDIPNPSGVYAISKLAGEFFASNTNEKSYITRFPTMFGPRKNKSLGFVDKMVEFMNAGKEIRVVDDKIDSPTYTVDAARQLISILENKMPFGVYHVANAGKVSYYDFISELAEKIGYNKEIIRAKNTDFPSDVRNPLKTAMKSIKLNPMRGWREALDDYIKEDIIRIK